MPEYLTQRKTEVPQPIRPVPVRLDLFPGLPELLRGETARFDQKIAYLSYYYLFPASETIHWNIAERPDNIEVDYGCSWPVVLFQSPDDILKPVPENRRFEHEVLALSSGLVSPFFWDGVRMGDAFQVQQFQTTLFRDRSQRKRTAEELMMPYLGFVNWQGLFLEYYAQSLKYAALQGKQVPEFLSVDMLSRHGLIVISREIARQSQAKERQLTIEECERIKADYLDRQRQKYGRLGFVYEDDHGGAQLVRDLREVRLNPAWGKYFQ